MAKDSSHTVWEKNTPDPLVDLAARCILAHPECLFSIRHFDSDDGWENIDIDDDYNSSSPTFVELTSNPSTSSAAGLGTSPSSNLHGASTSLSSFDGLAMDKASTTGGTESEFDFCSEGLSGGASATHPGSSRQNSVGGYSRRRFLLHKGLRLPAEICEKLFTTLHDEGVDLEDDFALAFADTSACRIRSVNVSGSSVTNRGLKALLGHNLRVLNIHNCRNLTTNSLEMLNACSENLVDLTIGNSVRFLPEYVSSNMDDDSEEMDEEDQAMADLYSERGYILHAPNLHRLVIYDLSVSDPKYFDMLLSPLTRLTHLDLSGAQHSNGFGQLDFLVSLQNLTSLVLYNIDELLDDEAVKNICTLKKIRHLDISHSDDKRVWFSRPTAMLRKIVESLPILTSLDISGTNLASRGVFEADTNSSSQSSVLCDIPGLVSRVDRPLEFLGLYRTQNEACCRAHIPAKQISGDANEAQILVAGLHYLSRNKVLESVLNDLFHIFRYENCTDVKTALDIILQAMQNHPGDKVIQISGSASLYYVVKSEIHGAINIKLKRKILTTLLNGMFAHKSDSVMMRNGCLTLCRFQIPQDVLFDYERLVNILLYIVSVHKGEDNNFVQRAGICLLNSLACQVDGQQKLLVGNLGAMEKMLGLIREKVQDGVCDDVMETAWSCMWNVTDETPVNCRRFLDGGGMELFLQCKEEFPDKHDLLRNMMGLLGNVAEVPELRPQLMTPNFVSEFKMLLESTSDGIEVSYNAAGVLAHMASDGPEAWTIEDPSRVEVLDRMVVAMDRWNLTSERNINYRSFEPILRLVRVSHTPQCQHWAVWALANLTSVDGKYCALIAKEGGLQLLEELINGNVRPPSYDRILELANIVRNNVSQWQRDHDQTMAATESTASDDVSEDALDLDG